MKRTKGINFLKLRVALGLTQEQMAQLLETTQGAISGYEKGLYMPKIKTVFKIMLVVSEYNLNFETEDFIE